MKTKITLLTIILFSTLILMACGGDQPPVVQQSQPTTSETTPNVIEVDNNDPDDENDDNVEDDDTSTTTAEATEPTNADTANATPNTTANAEIERISGIVEAIGNGQFEISLMTETEMEDGVLFGFEDPDVPWQTIIIDENTLIETVSSDGMYELDRWNSTFTDIEIGNSIMIYGFHIGDQFHATEIVIWSWTFM